MVEEKEKVQHPLLDASVWDNFRYRKGDIVIGSYSRAGTTWVQQVVAQLIFDGATNITVWTKSPWMDLRIPPTKIKRWMVERQTHRRFFKTHLPISALSYSPEVKYIYVARDGRDIAWSLYHHHLNLNPFFYWLVNSGRTTSRFERPEQSAREYILHWMKSNGDPFWPFWEHVKSWWSARTLANVLLVHYADLKNDLEGEIARIAHFLDISPSEGVWGDIVEHCTFDYMKENARQFAPLSGLVWKGGAQSFINKGSSERWKDTLTDEDSRMYEEMALDNLGDECAAWLASGKRGTLSDV